MHRLLLTLSLITLLLVAGTVPETFAAKSTASSTTTEKKHKKNSHRHKHNNVTNEQNVGAQK